MARETHPYLLEWSKMITPHIKHLCFKRKDESILPFIAGQFITLHIPDPNNPEKILHRSYSIANIPNKNNFIEIACAFVENGRATQLLFNLQPGESVQASGPYGLFVLKEEKPKRLILIATGTGVTPYRSMLDEITKRLKEDPELNVHLILGIRNQSELLFSEDFLACANGNDRFRFLACYSRPDQDKALDAFECHGHVQDCFGKINLNPDTDLVYLCGNPNMIDDVFKILTDKGFDKKAIKREKYLFAH